MNDGLRLRVDGLFADALERPPQERRAWLAARCGDEPEVLQEVLALLRAHERADGILDVSPAAVPRSEPDPAGDGGVGRRVGAYRLVSVIGRGGMGAVWLAERDDRQFHHKVAVKILHPGAAGEDVVPRFLAERQIMASLQHPNIARLLDGGVTEEGDPYLVMEYVPGRPIDAYCDERHLTIEERLTLFGTVARAVHYAHRNLVVHRDLKPSNILVTDEGEVKLLDFGIAKILDPSAHALTMPATRTGLLLMTPEYASPEQVRGEPITTATDVYGLGLVLYELLCGRRAHRLEGRMPAEVERVVCEQPPARPSTAVFLAGAAEAEGRTPEDVGAARGLQAGRLRRKLSGDLDRIVATALRKEPERRYPSAEQLAEDLDRYLSGRPVSARGDSAAYRVRRFMSRHRWAVAAALLFVVLLAGYAGTVTVQERQVRLALERARLEAEKAEQVTTFLMRLFETDEGAVPLGDAVTARDLLERGLERAEGMTGRPAAQAQMLGVVGRVYQHLGEYERAQPLLERAVELRREALGDASDAALAESIYDLAEVEYDLGHWDRAEALFREALSLQRQLLGSEHPQVARTLNGLSIVLRDKGEYAAAEPLAREALAMRRRTLGEEHLEVAESINYLAALLRRMGDFEASEPLYRDALAMRRRLLGNEHPDVAESLNNLALQLQQTGDLDAAEPLYREALDLYRRLLGPEHPFVGTTMTNLANLLRHKGDLEGAEPLYRQAHEIRLRALGPEHPEVARGLGHIATLRLARGDLAGAEALSREVLDLRRRILGEEHPEVAVSLHALGTVRLRQADTVGALRLYREGLAMRRRLLGDQHPNVAASLHAIGLVLDAQGRHEAAEPLLREALEVRRRVFGEDHAMTASTARALVALYEAWGRSSEADRFRPLAAAGRPATREGS